MTTGIISTTGLLSELQTVFVIILAVLAVVALIAGFKGKFGNALGIVAIIIVGCSIWGVVALFQSGAGAAFAARIWGAVFG